MLRAVFLDTGPLGLVTQRRGKSEEADACRAWLDDLISKNVRVYVPEVTDYELRRELTRSKKTAGVERLDRLKVAARFLPITSEAMLLASDLWADVRNRNAATADEKALDCDVILAAQVLTSGVPLDACAVATTNVGHLSRLYTPAATWREITAQIIPAALLEAEEEAEPVTDTELLEDALRAFFSIPEENRLEISWIGRGAFEVRELRPDGSSERDIVGEALVRTHRGKPYIRALAPLVEPELTGEQLSTFWAVYDVVKARLDEGERTGQTRILLARNTEFPDFFMPRGQRQSVAGCIREGMLPAWIRIDNRLRLRGYLVSMSYEYGSHSGEWELRTQPKQKLGALL